MKAELSLKNSEYRSDVSRRNNQSVALPQTCHMYASKHSFVYESMLSLGPQKPCNFLGGVIRSCKQTIYAFGFERAHTSVPEMLRLLLHMFSVFGVTFQHKSYRDRTHILFKMRMCSSSCVTLIINL